MARKTSTTSDSTANLGFEAKLWITADKLRNNMDAAECQQVLSANRSVLAHQSDEGDIRKATIEANLVHWLLALPGECFHSSKIPVSLGRIPKSEAVHQSCAVSELALAA